jgi:hypothetical protein
VVLGVTLTLDLEKPALDTCAEPRLGQVAEQEFGLELLGDLYTFKVTGDALSVTELTAFPQNGPPPHIHQREDESFPLTPLSVSRATA